MIVSRFLSRKVLHVASVVIFSLASFNSYVLAAELDDVKAAIKAKNANWVAGETSMSKLTPDERRRKATGILPEKRDMLKKATPLKQLRTITGSAEAIAAPSSLDWRNYNGNYVTPIKQNGCADCWAFAITAALESQVLITYGLPGQNIDLSEQTLDSCCTDCWDIGACEGGYLSYAADFISTTSNDPVNYNNGLPLEECLTYAGTDESCSNACANWTSAAFKINGWSFLNYPSVDDIKNALTNYGPLPATITVYDDFYYYQSGIYSYVWGSRIGPHGIDIIGYDDSGQYFICKNSWGTDWGESGFFRIAYSQINSDVNFAAETIVYGNAAAPSTAQHDLTVNMEGSGNGTVTGNGLSCNETTCTGSYFFGDTIGLPPNANTYSVLDSWSGCDNLTIFAGLPYCVLQMSTDKVVTASFRPAEPLDTWTINNIGSPYYLYRVRYANNIFIAFGYEIATGNDAILTSPDGNTWSAAYNSALLYDVAFGNGTFVAAGVQATNTGGHGVIQTWLNGTTWTTQASVGSDISSGITVFNGITFGNNKFVAVGFQYTDTGGFDGLIETSPDGVTWTNQAPGTSNPLQGIAFGNNMFIAVGDGGTILTSPDGVLWTAQTSGTSNPLQGIAFGNNMFVAVGDGGMILISSDGVSWTSQAAGMSNIQGLFACDVLPIICNTTYLGGGYHLIGATYGNNTFLTVGDMGTILSAPDGITWKSRISGTNNQLSGIAYGNNTFVAVGDATIIQSAPPVNGACGSANGQTLSSVPSGSSLCNAGTASAISGTGPWKWTCAGLNGGTNAVCSTVSPLVTGVTVTANPQSPQQPGAQVTFNATATGGSGNYQYYFTWLNPNTGTWSVGQAYSSASSWTWNTTGLGYGTYKIQVWARSAESTASYEAYQSISYTLKSYRRIRQLSVLLHMTQS